VAQHDHDALTRHLTRPQTASNQRGAYALTLPGGNDGHRSESYSRDHGPAHMNRKATEENMTDNPIIFDGHQRRDHKANTSQPVYKNPLRGAMKRL
jgi:hypothetical protein